MTTIATFLAFLAGIKRTAGLNYKGEKTEAVQQLLLLLAQGVRRQMVKQHKFHAMAKENWRTKFQDNLPYPLVDCLVFNHPPEEEEQPSPKDKVDEDSTYSPD